jgi:hypothetical protein
MQSRVFELTGKSTATTYHFSTSGGWALASVNDHTGELLIMSDWGHWSNRWNATPSALGAPTLTNFIAGMNHTGYIADKLTSRYENSEKPCRDAYDGELTKQSVLEAIIQRRRDDDCMSKELARQLWDDVNEDIDFETADTFVRSFYDVRNSTKLSDEPWDFCCRTVTNSFLILRDQILPAVIAACRIACHLSIEMEPAVP